MNWWDHWIDALAHGGVTSFGGAGVFFALALIIALRFLLLPSQRRRLRFPVGLLAAHVACVAVRAVMPKDWDAQTPLRVLALFLLLASVGRLGFIFTIDWLIDRRLRRPLSKIVRDIIHVLVYVMVAAITLRAIGVDPGSLLTTSALLTAVIGLSLQETLGNLFAGLAMQAQRPFEVGDWIQFDDNPMHVGRVTEINWRATKVLTNDQIEVTVPNGILAKALISNFSQPTKVSRRILKVQAHYDAPPRIVMAALHEGVRGAPGVLARPEPLVYLSQYADSGVEFWVLYHIDDFEVRNVIDSEVRTRIWYSLKRAGVTIPYPQRDVHFYDMSSEQQLRKKEERVASRAKALRGVDFLDVLPGDALELLARSVQTRLYTSGETVIRQGDEGSELFIILRGEVAVVVGHDGAGTEVARLGAGKFFGEMSLMTGEARTASVHATTECEMLVVGHEAFHDVLVTAPELAERISHVLAKRQAQLDERASNPTIATGQETARSGVLLKRIKEFFSI